MLFFLTISCLIIAINGLEREISSSLNPNCSIEICNSTDFAVVHVKAEGPDDTIHYIWDFTGIPGVLLALTSKESILSIDWENFYNGSNQSITFSPPPVYVFGFAIKQIIEFNDIDDSGSFNRSSNDFVGLDPSNFNWTRVQYEQHEKSVTVKVSASGYNDGTVVKNGSLLFQVKVFGYFDHADELPRLVHTSNTTQMDIELNDFSPSPMFSNSRYAIEFVIVSQDPSTETMTIVQRKSLDDENAPGVFTLVDIVTPSSLSHANGGYLQWRPVAYLADQRDISNSTSCRFYSIDRIDPSSALNRTLWSAYYNSTYDDNVLVQSATISFGEPEDGFYKKTKYTAWTFAVGYGDPPSEEFSLLIILVISIGLGLPAILVVISGIVLSIKRSAKKKDDLFLSR